MNWYYWYDNNEGYEVLQHVQNMTAKLKNYRGDSLLLA